MAVTIVIRAIELLLVHRAAAGKPQGLLIV